MIQQVQTWITLANRSLMKFTIFEQQVVTGGLLAITILCLIFPVLLQPLITLLGIVAGCAGGYSLYHLLGRLEARDADYD